MFQKSRRNSNAIFKKERLSGRKMVGTGNERFEVVIRHVLGSDGNRDGVPELEMKTRSH